MKRIFFTTILLCCSLCGLSQTNTILQSATTTIPNNEAKFLLFQTKNNHILLKLDTSNGKIWMVQFSTGDTDALEIAMPSYYYPLISETEEKIGRFYLYQTNNIYNYLLLDQINGRVWQVQWHTDPDKRIITEIN